MPESQPDNPSRARTALRQRLECLQRAGVRHLPKPPVSVVSNAPPVTPRHRDEMILDLHESLPVTPWCTLEPALRRPVVGFL